MKNQRFEELFEQCGAVLSGHFLLTSGLHSDTYVEKFKLLQFPKLTDIICKEIADHFEDKKPSVILGAATGGIIISQAVGRELTTRSIFAERVDGELILRRGFKINKGERVLIVDDVVTTGGSIYELLDLVTEYGGQIMGVGTLIDRSGKNIDFGTEYFPVVKYDIPVYKPENCPLCASNTPMTSRGRTGK